MEKGTPQWSKDVRKALIDKNMTIKQLAEHIGYAPTTVSTVINGRYSNASYQIIAEKINGMLGTKGLPERTNALYADWCKSVKIELIDREMSVNQLAEKLNISRDRLSLVINCRMMNKEIVDAMSSLLNIKMSVVPSGDN